MGVSLNLTFARTTRRNIFLLPSRWRTEPGADTYTGDAHAGGISLEDNHCQFDKFKMSESGSVEFYAGKIKSGLSNSNQRCAKFAACEIQETSGFLRQLW